MVAGREALMARARLQLEEFMSDPFGTLARARAAGWLAEGDAATAVVRHEAVRELLADGRLRANFPDFLRAFGVSSGAFYEWMSGSPLNHDGAEHQRWRSVMSKTFTPRRVEGIRPFLGQAAHELIDGFAVRGRCDFMAEFADLYPALGLCELIGVPRQDRDRFRGWADTVGLGFSPIDLTARIGEVDAALTQLLAYAGELAAARRAEPRDDLVTRIALAAAEDGWTDDAVRASIAGLVFAGHETTKNQLGWMVAVLADHPDVWERVAAGTLPVAEVVEEALRFRSAVTGVGRTVSEPFEHRGERVEPGTQLFLSVWSADHDETVYPRPEALDPVAHAGLPHLAFGHGAHFCLGAALARAELQEALAALTARIGCPRLEEGAQWRPPVGINGPLRLPIGFAARG
jgi:cytochrome P450